MQKMDILVRAFIIYTGMMEWSMLTVVLAISATTMIYLRALVIISGTRIDE